MRWYQGILLHGADSECRRTFDYFLQGKWEWPKERTATDVNSALLAGTNGEKTEAVWVAL